MNDQRPDDSPASAQPRDPEGWGDIRNRTISWHDPQPTAAAGAQMSGLDYLTAMQDGRLPASPIAQLIDLVGVSASHGEIVFRCTPDESTYNPLGFVHGGVLCTILDSAAGCAVHTTLPPGVGYTSIEIKVSYIRPVTAGVALTARGWVTKPGRRVAFAEAEILGGDDKVLATASSSCLILSAPGA